MLVLCVVAFCVVVAAPAIASIADNRLVNPGAEDGLVGWQGTGFGSVGYEESGVPRFPEPNFVPGSAPDLGVRLFAATTDAAIWQTVDVFDLAARIDSGAQPLSIGGLLGGRGGQEGGARLVAQPLDAAGAALGAPYVAGYPTDRDRQSRTALLPCSIDNQIAPVGTRAVLVRLEAVGHGLADRLFLGTERGLPNASLQPPTRVADGPGCSTGERVGPWPPGSASEDPPPAGREAPLTAKLSIARATINRRDRVLDVLAPITSLASGRVDVELHAAERRVRFTAPVNSTDGRIRFRQRIPAAQADLGTGIVTITYPGDADTRPQTVRLRAASQQAQLRLERPTITDGRLRAWGTLSDRARGVVRVQVEYVVAGNTSTLQFKARISNGRWSLDEQLSQEVRTAIEQRTGTVHSYTLFTGYFQDRVRGEMRSFQVLGRR